MILVLRSPCILSLIELDGPAPSVVLIPPGPPSFSLMPHKHDVLDRPEPAEVVNEAALAHGFAEAGEVEDLFLGGNGFRTILILVDCSLVGMV